jgi:hypothetical protein
MPTYRHGPARIVVADSISTPIDQWTYMGHTRGGTVEHDVALSFGRVNELSKVPIAEAVWAAPVSQAARFRIADSDMLKLVQAHPGAVRVASGTKEALTLPASPQAYTSKAVAIIPELEHTDNLFADSPNVTYFQDAILRIEEVPAGTDPGESDDAILAYDLVIESLSGAVGRGYPAIGSPSIYPQGIQFLWEPQYDGLVPKVRDSYSFTRGSTATYVDSNGVIQTAGINVARYDAAGVPMLEPQRTNLILNSSDFAGSGWGVSQASITRNTTASPDGGALGDTITGTGGTTSHWVGSTITTVNSQEYTFSVFVKPGTLDFVQLLGGGTAFGSNVFANFDLLNGTIGTVGSDCVAGIESISGGWYRVWIRAVSVYSGSSQGVFVLMSNSASLARAGSFNSTVDTVNAFGAQLETSDYATSYIPTSGTTVTRSADAWGGAGTFTRASTGTYVSGGVVKHAGTDEPRYQDSGLLLEPQRTNYQDYSRPDSTWTKRGAVVVTENNAASPDGTTNATKVENLGAKSTDDFFGYANGHAVSVAVAASFYLKKISPTGTLEVVNPVPGSGTTGRWVIDLSLVGSGWERMTPDHVAVTEATAWVSHTDGRAGLWLYAPSGSIDVYLWGVQSESGSYPTSYIPTAGSSVTRNVDTLSFPHTNALGAYGKTLHGKLIRKTPITLSHNEVPFSISNRSTSTPDGKYWLGVQFNSAGKAGMMFGTDGTFSQPGGATAIADGASFDVTVSLRPDDTRDMYTNDVEEFKDVAVGGGMDFAAADLPEANVVRIDTSGWSAEGTSAFVQQAIAVVDSTLTPAQIRRFLR